MARVDDQEGDWTSVDTEESSSHKKGKERKRKGKTETWEKGKHQKMIFVQSLEQNSFTRRANVSGDK